MIDELTLNCDSEGMLKFVENWCKDHDCRDDDNPYIEELKKTAENHRRIINEEIQKLKDQKDEPEPEKNVQLETGGRIDPPQ